MNRQSNDRSRGVKPATLAAHSPRIASAQGGSHEATNEYAKYVARSSSNQGTGPQSRPLPGWKYRLAARWPYSCSAMKSTARVKLEPGGRPSSDEGTTIRASAGEYHGIV
jgi:hypothetical protein